jgi:5-methyltetrahydrofolate--homocysteine methyltransferase
LRDAGAVAVGANCTVAIDGMVEVARALGAAGAGPLMLQPNAGKPEVVEGRTVYRETPKVFADRVPDLLAAGARIIGGCCGTDARFIEAVRHAVDELAPT